jgi:hypothetical protein
MDSNARIARTLIALADDVELGIASPTEVRDSLPGHIGAIDRIPYTMVKEAKQIVGQLSQAIDSGREQDVNCHALGDWLRGWASKVPVDSK